jgi:hypothetical protein
MDKLIPVLVDPPLSKHREFVCLWLNEKEEAKKPSHYLITKEQLFDVFEAGKAYRASMADNTTKAKFHDSYFKDLGVE